jgi:hypothetical protein
MVQTVWAGAGSFMDEFYGRKTDAKAGENTAAQCFREMFGEIQKLNEEIKELKN